MSTPHPLVAGPILTTLIRLAAPNVLTMSLGVLVSIAETLYIGLLGTVPLAAMALVYPFAMLVQMLSSGAMGGGVSSAIARALGAGGRSRAQALALHAIVIGVAAGVLHMAVMLAFGPRFYALLGGRGEVLAEAIGFGAVLFIGTPFVWLLNAQLSIVRGTGDMVMPARIMLVVSILQIAVGALLGLGLGPLPRLGLPGVACGTIAAYGIGALWLLVLLRAGHARLTLSLAGGSLRRSLFADILRVGVTACLSPAQSVLTILLTTALIAPFGTAALAAGGIVQRLEFLLVPLSFGIGVAAVPMVGMAIGAGAVARARRVAWTAATLSLVNLSVIGVLVALAPGLWAGLFTADPEVIETAAIQLRWVGPAFGFFGFGLTLYFAAQGSGRILGPVLAASVRLALVAGVGFTLQAYQAPLWCYFALIAGAMCAYAAACALAVGVTRWR